MLSRGGLTSLFLLLLVQLAVCIEDYYKVRTDYTDLLHRRWQSSHKGRQMQVLGVDRQATDKQLKSAYRQLSKKYHPDKNPYVLASSMLHARGNFAKAMC